MGTVANINYRAEPLTWASEVLCLSQSGKRVEEGRGRGGLVKNSCASY